LSCPYDTLPTTSWWSTSVASKSPRDIDPHLAPRPFISQDTRIASAGSCFAQHISNALHARGFNYMDLEPAPPALPKGIESRYGYGIFSARYGNVYTALQLLQLIDRAFGRLTPVDQVWTDGNGRWFDLLRPRIMPRGFSSKAELEADLKTHLAAVRALFENLDVFVFTLGLTESWRSRADGAVYPTCPGCGSAGTYDETAYRFHNFNVTETIEHLGAAIDAITSINSAARIILTVSPVPLIATMEQRHVLQSTSYSKSVLRVAAEEMVRNFSNVEYFGSFEIITATYNTQEFFADDRRSVTNLGVEHAMATFFKQFTFDKSHHPETARPTSVDCTPPAVLCDEESFFQAAALRSNV
jgi:hypothetical protein